MSKKVELIFEIDQTGKILVSPKGTVGKECMDLMAFLDKIAGVEVSTTRFEDVNKTNKDFITDVVVDKNAD